MGEKIWPTPAPFSFKGTLCLVVSAFVGLETKKICWKSGFFLCPCENQICDKQFTLKYQTWEEIVGSKTYQHMTQKYNFKTYSIGPKRKKFHKIMIFRLSKIENSVVPHRHEISLRELHFLALTCWQVASNSLKLPLVLLIEYLTEYYEYSKVNEQLFVCIRWQ